MRDRSDDDYFGESGFTMGMSFAEVGGTGAGALTGAAAAGPAGEVTGVAAAVAAGTGCFVLSFSRFSFLRSASFCKTTIRPATKAIATRITPTPITIRAFTDIPFLRSFFKGTGLPSASLAAPRAGALALAEASLPAPLPEPSLAVLGTEVSEITLFGTFDLLEPAAPAANCFPLSPGFVGFLPYLVECTSLPSVLI